jgi:lysozyme family protein
MIDQVIDGILTAEGGYVFDKNDSGGETNFGITVMVAKANGYYGVMKDLPKATARQIYLNRYWLEPHFDRVATLSPAVAEELCDTGVNCGTAFAQGILQQALNLLNRQEADYKDISEDGSIGPGSLAALAAFLSKRGKEGETVLVRTLNIMQGARYIEITKTNAKNESFFYGWILNRVSI